MNDESSNTANPLDEQIVAYLDGELDPEGRRRIEELLATDAEVRLRLREMERAWDLLDDLDSAAAGSQFTQSTLEMVAVSASQEVEKHLAEAPRRRRRRWFAIGGSLLAALLAGFLAVVLLWPDPNRQLLQDLPVLENLDQYEPVDDIGFLQMLRDAGMFSNEDDETPGAPTAAASDESLAQRRARIADMRVAEKGELLRRQEQFDALDPEQQERLRTLHESLQTAADATLLRQIMRRYCDWLKTLPSYTRAELAELKPADRVKSVQKQLIEEQIHRGGRRFSPKDAEALMKWIDQCLAGRKKELQESLSPTQRKRLAEATPAMRQRLLFWLMWQRWQAAGFDAPPPIMTNDDLARLRPELSPKLQQRLESQPTAEQWRLVGNWMRHVLQQQGATRGVQGPLSKADDERMAEFFERELSEEERDRLLSLPGEEMQRALQRLYLTRTQSLEGPGRRPEGHRRDKGPSGNRPAPKDAEKGTPAPR